MARAPKTAPVSKSANFIALIKGGATIAEVAKSTGSNYAFVYGVAKKAGLAGTAANRRAVRAISTDDSGMIVTIRLVTGGLVVDRATGKTRRIK